MGGQILKGEERDCNNQAIVLVAQEMIISQLGSSLIILIPETIIHKMNHPVSIPILLYLLALLVTTTSCPHNC